jgi:hypothetical protein
MPPKRRQNGHPDCKMQSEELGWGQYFMHWERFAQVNFPFSNQFWFNKIGNLKGDGGKLEGGV